ncbi:MAG: glycosyltransferase family 2 protein [Anaerolineae bacterium]|nr:glycosyltransferase family 2 protein [Anaerolineae bacterium]
MALAYYDVNLINIRPTLPKRQHPYHPGDQTVVAIIPAYNEARTIGQIALEMRRYAAVVLVVDDGSTDGTAEVARAAGATVVSHAQNQGKGAALDTGFRAAYKLNPDLVITIDADGQHLPQETTRLIAPILTGQADLVVGSRYLQNTSNTPRHRIWGHRVFNFIINQISGISLTDTQCGFRAFSAGALRAISFQSNGFAVESEMQFLARKFGLRVAEVPVTVRYEGKVKRSVLVQGLLVLAGILRLTACHRPALCCSSLSVLCLLFGLLWGIWPPDFYQPHPPPDPVYLTATFPFTIVGLVILLAGFVVHAGQPLMRMLRSSEPEA